MVVLAATETPVWAAILLAVVAGVFGLLSGAAAATVISTSHETRERFRDRMIEAADGFIAQETEAFESLIRFESAFAAGLTESYGSSSPFDPEAVRPAFSAARKTLDQLHALIPRLWVVFRSPDPGKLAERIAKTYSENLVNLGLALDPERFHSPAGEAFKADPNLVFKPFQEQVYQTHDETRKALLEALNRELRRRWRL
jgi:hypothetical protein